MGERLTPSTSALPRRMNIVSQSIISGMMIGAVYALMGIGLVIVYRTSRILNLAHGESFAIAGVVASAVMAAGQPYWLAFILAMCAAIVTSLALYRFVLRPRERWPLPALVIATLAVAFVVRGAGIVAIGPDAVSFPPLFRGDPLHVMGGILPFRDWR